jgi:hypothetical protein
MREEFQAAKDIAAPVRQSPDDGCGSQVFGFVGNPRMYQNEPNRIGRRLSSTVWISVLFATSEPDFRSNAARKKIGFVRSFCPDVFKGLDEV